MSNRLYTNILSAWKGISMQFSGKRLDISPYLHTVEHEPLKVKIAACLEGKGGEVSARARAAELGQAYMSLNDEGRGKFLNMLITDFNIDHDQIRNSAEALFKDLSSEERSKVEDKLRLQLTPPYLTLLTQFNALPQGVKFLVDLRADAMRLSKEQKELKEINDVLRTQLSSWFDIGFLNLKQIDWNASASLLEKLIEYEAVHKITSWDDLHHRLGDNRRCFAFFHPRMPEEPLIFVWVALVDEISNNVTTILDTSQEETAKEQPSTAVFYSISSTQKGLAGVSLGNFLIKRVVDELKRECPSLEKFATLSPIPGFSTWLKEHALKPDAEIFSKEELSTFENAGVTAQTLVKDATWYADEAVCEVAKDPMQRLVAKYIVEEKRSNDAAANSVAHFHLSNGAIFERVNWMGDVSEHGLEQSYGMMINYLYDLNVIDKNHEQYVDNGSIAKSKSIQQYF